MIAESAKARLRPIAAATGASASTVTVYADSHPGPLLSSLHGIGVSAVAVFVAFTCCGLWVLRHASGSAWRWAAGIGVVLTTAQLVGLALRRSELHEFVMPQNLPWVLVEWFGTAWMVTGCLAALVAALDSHGARSNSEPGTADVVDRGVFGRIVESLRSSDPVHHRRGWLTVMGILVLSRIPYLVAYWPGIVPMVDTFRSYSYARGLVPWDTYEPVGNSMFVAVVQWLGTKLG